MYCSNCGKEINDNVKFCKYCGANLIEEDINHNENENVEISKQNKAQLNTVFNRDVLNNYLYNIRTLEVYKNKLLKHINNLDYNISQLGYRKVGDDGYSSYTIEDILPALACSGIGLLFGAICAGLKNTGIAEFFEIEGFLGGLSVFAIIISIIIAIGSVIYLVINNSNSKQQYDINRSNDIKRVEQEIVQKNQLINQMNNLNNELDKIDKLLSDAYSINIIPSKFRNIYAIYFIYDFIATSTASLNEALIHCDLDKIQQQLENVIQQQEEIIIELARSNALNEQIIAQNNQMLNHAIQTESNTALAAQYTKAAATNSSVVACIAMSEYLKP